MQDLTFNAALEAAKLTARTEDDKTIRRVVFKLSRGFSLEQAEWLGDEACHMRGLMNRGVLEKFTQPIDAYVGKITLTGGAGTATAEVFGLAAVASMSGGEMPEPLMALTFEAFPEAKLLTFLAASIKEFIDVELLASQTEIGAAVEKFKDTLAPFDRVTTRVGDGPEVVLKGAKPEATT
jgi:hypothetical protein